MMPMGQVIPLGAPLHAARAVDPSLQVKEWAILGAVICALAWRYSREAPWYVLGRDARMWRKDGKRVWVTNPQRRVLTAAVTGAAAFAFAARKGWLPFLPAPNINRDPPWKEDDRWAGAPLYGSLR